MKDLNSVHLNGLRAAEAVGRLGSLAAAAEELGVTAGAVSQQIAKTEAQLGRTLFERSPRGLVVSDSGRALLTRLSSAFRELAEAVAQARRRDESVLTVSVAPVFAARWLVYRLDRFAEHHPDIRLRIDATTTLADLETSDVDLGIRVGAGRWPGVRSELLLEQEVFPVCSPALAAGLREPADILKLPAVIDAHGRDHGARQRDDRICQGEGGRRSRRRGGRLRSGPQPVRLMAPRSMPPLACRPEGRPECLPLTHPIREQDPAD